MLVFVPFIPIFPLADRLVDHCRHMVQITPGFIFPYNIYLIPFASIVGVCFILMVSFMVSYIDCVYVL